MKIWMIVLAVTLLPAAALAADGNGTTGDVSGGEDIEARLSAIEAELARYSSLNVVPASHQHGVEGMCPDCGMPVGQSCTGDCIGIGGQEPNGFPSVKLRGFFQLDAGYYSQDLANQNTLGDIEDGLGFRRTRLAGAGKVADDVSFIIEMDFAQAQARFVDVWMQFDDTPLGKVRIGRFRQPFGMAEMTSVRELPFLERFSGFALAPFRQTGIMLSDVAIGERATWSVAGYRCLSDNFGNVYSDTGGYGAAMRFTCLPVDSGDGKLLHVGFDYSFNDIGRGQVQYTSTNEFFVGQQPNLGPAGLSVLPIVAVPAFVSTGAIAADATNLFNIEAAAAWGRLIVQSEARWAVVDQTSGARTTFPSAYAHIRYVLTGEVIPYNRSTGVFGRVKPLEPIDLWRLQGGAWELAARWSYIDLNGTAVPGPGRQLNNVVAGLNWYLNDYTKFQFNWIHSELNDPTEGGSTAETLAVRGQVDF